MPQQRTLLAAGGGRRFERVVAHPREGWGPVYRAPNRRWVLPGSGPVQWRSDSELLVVDDLTGFQLVAGELYQLQHEATRDHVVISDDETRDRPALQRAWFVSPAELLKLRLAIRAVRDGGGVSEAAGAILAVLAGARPVDARAQPASLILARRFLVRDVAQRHSLAAVAEEARASPFHLERLARRHLGIGVHQYRLRLRMASALARLEAGERDLAGLAHDLGFSSQSHFGAVFRRETGHTPAQARRLLSR